MFQPEHVVESAAGAASEAAAGTFNAGEVIIEHVSNSPIDHPLIHLPTVFGIDFSVTKHVFMLWVVAALVFLIVTTTVRRYLRQDRLVPSGFMNALEIVVEFVRDGIVEPNVGRKWVKTWTPLLLTLGIFILAANVIGLIPIFDVLSLINHTVLHLPEESFMAQVLHGGTTATGNFNVTAALATITFFAIIIAGRARARLRAALEEHGAARAAAAGDDHADPDRDHGHVRPAVRAHDATCRQHDRRPHRHPRDPVVRVHFH